MDHLKDRTVIITGASRGIGEATARDFAAAGANVVLVARSQDAITAIAAEISAAGGNALALPADVADYAAVADLVAQTRTAFGRVDTLVNNAGVINPIARLSDSDPHDWAKAFDINLKGVYFCTRAVLPGMVEAGAGTIINISSGAANAPLEGWSHYCSSKAATQMLTRATHKEYGEHGIRAIGLSPGTVATEMQVEIKSSGINPVSQLDPAVHIPAGWVSQGIAYLCSPAADDLCGTDFSLKTDEGRARVGLPAV
ncbi:MAG: SDR family oxidoreductase [Pseudomonadota bacterium]